MARIRALLIGGLITDNPLTATAAAFNSANLANLPVVVAPDYAPVVLYDPTGAIVAAEIVYVTAHTSGSTTATITRAQEGTTARSHSTGEAWVNGPTVADSLVTATAPPTPYFTSQAYYDMSTNQDYSYNGNAWVGDADEGMFFMQVGP